MLPNPYHVIHNRILFKSKYIYPKRILQLSTPEKYIVSRTTLTLIFKPNTD